MTGLRRPRRLQMHCYHARTSRGFTLVEIALVVIIASTLLLAGMRLLIARAESAQLELTRKNQDAIRTALIAYLGQNKRLPCPDTNLDGRENRDVPTNPPPCNAYSGTVPYLDLGLDRSAVLDGWENYIAYVVSPSQSTPPPPLVVPPWTTAWLYTYVSVITDPTKETNTAAPPAFFPTTSTGAIVVNDVNGNAISNPAANPPNGAVVVLISYGKNGFGAINVSGGANNPAGAVFDEATNITPVAAAGPPVQIVVVNRDITDQIIPNHGPFDDIVLPLRQNDLVAPLAVNGTLQSNPAQALSQANDYVIGQIAATRALCPGPNACGCSAPNYTYSIPIVAGAPVGAGPITYSAGGNLCFMSTTGAGTAYTLSSPDGNTRAVTNAEAIGILGRVGGF